ncbi:MAG: hypothetical protein JWM44_2948 [Bacilli bacterium]|jgi:hypothetical protein|nr:hypothetical protein [Bacilli bacterium]
MSLTRKLTKTFVLDRTGHAIDVLTDDKGAYNR